MKNKLVILAWLLCSVVGNAQKKKTVIYINEKHQITSSKAYYNKLKTQLFDNVTIKKEDTILKKLSYTDFFGKLSSTKIKQLQKLYALRYGIDSTKTWLIHYVDTLPDKSKMPKESGILFKNPLTTDSIFITQTALEKGNNSFLYEKYPYHKHLKSYPDYIDTWHKEITNTNYVDTSTTLLHFYAVNKGIPDEDIKKYGYYNDISTLLKKSFNDGTGKNKLIIIYPDGAFYTSTLKEHKKVKKLTQRRIYERKKQKWLKKTLQE
ncbi:hypothetical protein ACQY1Q_03085 [Tenacibaculum sp. TC6]|uniref:hypothetical protein n=1 Tax=Tenacibaculum sp. TC6 TaxID=3423223 RepID=UPI003D3698C9